MTQSGEGFNPVSAAAEASAAEPTTEPAADNAQEQDAQPETEAEAKPTEPAEPAEAPQDKWQAQFEKLSQRDAEVRSREKQLKDSEAKLNKQLKDNETKLNEANEMLGLAQSNPLAFLQKAGLSVDDVLKSHLNGGGPDTSKELEAMKARQMELESKLETQAKQAYLQQQGNKWESEFQEHLKSDEYKLVRDWEGADDVVRQRVVQHYQENQELLPAKEQLDIIKSEIEKRLEKMRGYLNPGDSQTDKEAEPSKASKKPSGPTTLTPTLGATPSRYAPWENDDLEMQRIAAKYNS